MISSLARKDGKEARRELAANAIPHLASWTTEARKPRATGSDDYGALLKMPSYPQSTNNFEIRSKPDKESIVAIRRVIPTSG